VKNGIVAGTVSNLALVPTPDGKCSIVRWFLWGRHLKPDLRFRTGEYAAKVMASTAAADVIAVRERSASPLTDVCSRRVALRYGADYELPGSLI
jgi:hypothetical protein